MPTVLPEMRVSANDCGKYTPSVMLVLEIVSEKLTDVAAVPDGRRRPCGRRHDADHVAGGNSGQGGAHPPVLQGRQ